MHAIRHEEDGTGRHDGKQLFYRAVGGGEEVLIAAAFDVRPELHITGRTELFSVAQYEDASPHANYDVAAVTNL